VSRAMTRDRLASADRCCPVCGRRALMDVRATYCSSACKQAAYRRRLRQSETSRQGSLCKVTGLRCRTKPIGEARRVSCPGVRL
jgi:hypothetical protein